MGDQSPRTPPASGSGPRDSLAIPRFLLAVASAAGVDHRRIAREARLPGWIHAADQALVPAGYSLRLWELIEHELGDPYYALRAAGLHKLGEMDVFDYLFMTSGTLAEGLRTSSKYLPLLTTNGPSNA